MQVFPLPRSELAFVFIKQCITHSQKGVDVEALNYSIRILIICIFIASTLNIISCYFIKISMPGGLQVFRLLAGGLTVVPEFILQLSFVLPNPHKEKWLLTFFLLFFCFVLLLHQKKVQRKKESLIFQY